MQALEHVLTDIEAIAENKDLRYQLESTFKDSSAARVIIRYIKSQNSILYSHMLISGNIPKGLANVVEEEVLLEISKASDKWKANWHWIKHLTEDKHKEKSIINSAILDIEDALKGTG